MYELIQAGARTYYIQSPAKAGLYAGEDGGVTLIDSGNDKEAGRKILQQLDARGWKLKTILNTHSNADHIGGNGFLQQRTGCAVYSTGIENAFLRYPALEPSFLYGGYPPNALRNKFLLAQPSRPAGEAETALPEGFELIPLPGHFFDMVGFRTPDDIVFLADSVFGAHIIEKYHINFLYDVGQYLETLDRVEKLEARLFIPAHAEPCEDIRPLVVRNRDKVLEIIGLLLSLCKEPIPAEELLAAVFSQYELHMDFSQYVLVGSTLRSYMAYLSDAGRAEAIFEENRLKWKAL